MSEKELSIFYCAWKYTFEHKRKTERRSFWISNFSADSRQVQFGSESRLLDRKEIASGNRHQYRGMAHPTVYTWDSCSFNLHPEKWFEGYPVKSTQFFSGWQKHLRFFRAWHLFFSDLYEIILRFACETNILMMAQSHYFHGLDNVYYRYLLVIYPVEQKSCVRCN